MATAYSSSTSSESKSAMTTAATSTSGVVSSSGPNTNSQVGNNNSRSVSMASMSSDGSNGSHMHQQHHHRSSADKVEIVSLTNDVREFKEALANLRKVFNPEVDLTETIRVACHERLSEALRILRHIMKKYPSIPTNDLVQSAQFLINQVKELGVADEDPLDENEFLMAIDALARSFSNRVSDFLMQDIDSAAASAASSSTSSKERDHVSQAAAELEGMALELREEALAPDQIDALLMRHHQGVDHALRYAKVWAKYAKDIMNYVEKRTNLELEWARGLSKLAQSTRPILKEESYLPFQSVYCTALDQDIELCSFVQATCARLQGSSFIEPLFARRQEHQKTRKNLKDRWTKELKTLQDSVSSLKKAKAMYIERCKEYERCREAVRIAEQGAEIGATGENKVDKRKRLEEDALEKKKESKMVYRSCVDEANEKHRQLLTVKAEILQQIRELIIQCDQTVKTVTVQYFQLHHTLTAPLPTQFQTLCERSRLYEPGSQFMEFVRCGLGDQPPMSRFSTRDPFIFEDDASPSFAGESGGGGGGVPRRSSASLEATGETDFSSGTYRFRGDHSAIPTLAYDSSGVPGAVATSGGPSLIAWPSSAGPVVDPSDTDTDSCKSQSPSRDTSPSASPMINSRHLPHEGILGPSTDDAEADQIDTSIIGGGDGGVANLNTVGDLAVSSSGNNTSSSLSRRSMNISPAAKTHKFRKLKAPTKCKECDRYVYLQGYGCQDCGLSVHKKCLEVVAYLCGHRRLPSRLKTFGVDLNQHLLESGSQIPPLVCKCVHEIDKRGIKIEGIYRRSGAKSKIEKLCQMFETAPELVELCDVQPFAIADVLKHYMRQLPEPLISTHLYSDFVSVVNNPDQSEETIIRELAELTRRLPKSHQRTLGFLMHHLHRVASESEENNMPASNLAILFAPNLMRANEGGSTSLSSSSHEKEGKVIELLILHAHAIFGPAESVVPKDYAKYTTAAAFAAKQNPDWISGGVKRGGRSKAARKFGSGSGTDLISSSHSERRSVDVQDDFPSLPAHALGGANESNNEDYLSDEDDDAEAIPSCWMPDESTSSTKKSPLLNRGTSSPPQIIKVSLKSLSGLEGVTTERLSTQASLENAQRLSKQASADVMSSRKSIPHDAGSSGATGHQRHHRTSETLFSRVGRAAKKHSLDEDFLSPPASGGSSTHLPVSERLSGEVPSGISTSPSLPNQDAMNQRKTPSPSSAPADTVDGGAFVQSITSPGSGRSSLTIGIGMSGTTNTSSHQPGRSSSLSEDHHASLSVSEQRKKFLSSSSTDAAGTSGQAQPSSHQRYQHQAQHSSSSGGTTSVSVTPYLSTSLPSNVIPNIEENRVTIQVPGMTRNPPHGVVKQASIEKDH